MNPNKFFIVYLPYSCWLTIIYIHIVQSHIYNLHTMFDISNKTHLIVNNLSKFSKARIFMIYYTYYYFTLFLNNSMDANSDYKLFLSIIILQKNIFCLKLHRSNVYNDCLKQTGMFYLNR